MQYYVTNFFVRLLTDIVSYVAILEYSSKGMKPLINS
jgi:hypothetical protein